MQLEFLVFLVNSYPNEQSNKPEPLHNDFLNALYYCVNEVVLASGRPKCSSVLPDYAGFVMVKHQVCRIRDFLSTGSPTTERCPRADPENAGGPACNCLITNTAHSSQ